MLEVRPREGGTVRVGAALRVTEDADLAAMEAADEVAQALGDEPCRLTVVFASPHHHEDLAGIGAAVGARLDAEVRLGAVAQGVAGPAREIESEAALAVWGAAFEEGELEPFRSWVASRPEGGMAVAGWPETQAGDLTLVLADPFSYPASQVTRHVSEERPGHRILGGLVTGGRGASQLLLGDEVHDEGAVGVVLRGVDVRPVVSQGCRPVGEPMTVTAGENNLILELAGEPAVDRLKRLFEEVEPEDRELMQSGLHLGLVADEYREDFATGDFLIRSVMGVDQERGAIAVGDHVSVGQVVQFQVRDADSAHQDLLEHLEGPADGALLFTCNGRGRKFFGEPDHDAALLGQHLTEAVAGAFCAGEIGPVGQRSFVHGFTASLAVFGGGVEDAPDPRGEQGHARPGR